MCDPTGSYMRNYSALQEDSRLYCLFGSPEIPNFFSMSGKTRSLFGTAFKHFINSLRPRQITGVFMGEDYHGNKYYEIAADPSRGKRLPQRYYEPPVETQFDQVHMPAEWDAWLRNRRTDPPSEDELKQNLSIAMMKKNNADKIAEKEGKKPATLEEHADMSSFPVYDDYESTPGKGIKK